jgi:hypothetical protein
MFDKRFLNNSEFAVFSQSFNRHDFSAIGLNGEMKAGFHKFVIEQNRAGAAFADDTTDVSPGKADIFPKEVRQQEARLDVLFIESPIDSHANGLFHLRLK